MKRDLLLFYSILIASLPSDQNSDATTLIEGGNGILDLEELTVITNNAVIDIACLVKINSI